MAATADRVLSVLELFSGDNSEWTVEEAAEALGLPVSTAYRYFHRPSPVPELIVAYSAGRYVLGPAIIQFDRQLRLHDPFITAAKPEMMKLAAMIGGDTVVLLARLYHNKVICVHQKPAISAALSAMSAAAPCRWTEVLRQVILYRGQGHPRSFKGEHGPARWMPICGPLRQIRQQGFAITEAEIDAGKRGIGVPVFRPDQTVEGSLSLVVEASRGEQVAMVEALINARKSIEATLAIRASTLAGIFDGS
jgi:DNA-binding IclR family transcriptional regulator